MKFLPAVAFLSVVAFASTTFAQQSVVLVDVGQVFKKHANFNAQMDNMKREVEIFQAQVQNKQAQIQKMAEAMNKLQPTDPQVKQYQTAIAQATANLQVENQLKGKEFMEREAQLYHSTYVDIVNRVAAYCKANNISLVLRYNSEPVKTEDRASILQYVNSNVVFERQRNVTSAIIAQVSSQTAARSNGPQATPNRK